MQPLLLCGWSCGSLEGATRRSDLDVLSGDRAVVVLGALYHDALSFLKVIGSARARLLNLC